MTDTPRINLCSRRHAQAFKEWADQNYILEPIPIRERIRRAWRDKKIKQLWRTHDLK